MFMKEKTTDLLERRGTEISQREKEILLHVAQGFTYKEIADQLYLSPETVKKHLGNCYRKLGAGNKLQALKKVGLL